MKPQQYINGKCFKKLPKVILDLGKLQSIFLMLHTGDVDIFNLFGISGDTSSALYDQQNR